MLFSSLALRFVVPMSSFLEPWCNPWQNFSEVLPPATPGHFACPPFDAGISCSELKSPFSLPTLLCRLSALSIFSLFTQDSNPNSTRLADSCSPPIGGSISRQQLFLSILFGLKRLLHQVEAAFPFLLLRFL